MSEVILPELQQSRTIITPASIIWVRLGLVGENLTVEVSETGAKCGGDSKQYCKTGGEIKQIMTLGDGNFSKVMTCFKFPDVEQCVGARSCQYFEGEN